MIRRPWGRPQPHVPIQSSRNGFAPEVTWFGRAAAVDVNFLDFSGLSAPTLADRPHVIAHHALAAAGNNPSITARGLDHCPALPNGERFRFLAVNIFPLAACGDHDDGMPVVWSGDVDRIDVFA